MQVLVPSYLEFTIGKLTGDQGKFREHMSKALASQPLAQPTLQMFGQMEEQTRKNMAMFTQALTMFNPFAAAGGIGKPEAGEKKAGEPTDLDDMKRDLQEMQKRLEKLARKG